MRVAAHMMYGSSSSARAMSWFFCDASRYSTLFSPHLHRGRNGRFRAQIHHISCGGFRDPTYQRQNLCLPLSSRSHSSSGPRSLEWHVMHTDTPDMIGCTLRGRFASAYSPHTVHRLGLVMISGSRDRVHAQRKEHGRMAMAALWGKKRRDILNLRQPRRDKTQETH